MFWHCCLAHSQSASIPQEQKAFHLGIAHCVRGGDSALLAYRVAAGEQPLENLTCNSWHPLTPLHRPTRSLQALGPRILRDSHLLSVGPNDPPFRHPLRG